MIYTASITSQGQISIPAPLRRKLGLEKSGKALITEQNGKVLIEPVPDLLSLKGSLKTNIKATPREIREAFGRYLAHQAVKNIK